MNIFKKNLLDLQHSFYLTKASLFFSIGAGGALAIFFGLIQIGIDTLSIAFVSSFWFVIFTWLSIIHFSRCEKIQDNINALIKENS